MQREIERFAVLAADAGYRIPEIADLLNASNLPFDLKPFTPEDVNLLLAQGNVDKEFPWL